MTETNQKRSTWIYILFALLLIGGGVCWFILKTPVPVPLPPPPTRPPPPPAPFVEESRPLPPPKPLPLPVKKKGPPKVVVPVTQPHVTRPPVVTPPPAPAPVPVAPPVALPEWQGNDTSVTHAGQVVIRNDRQWIHFWSEHHPHEAAPEVDFEHNMVIGVFAGPRPAEQFTISIVEARVSSGALAVTYRERLPPPGTFAVNVTVYPYHLKAISRSNLAVKFNALPPENVVR